MQIEFVSVDSVLCYQVCVRLWLQIAVLPLVANKDLLPRKELPGLSTILILDAVVAKVQVALDATFAATSVRRLVCCLALRCIALLCTVFCP